MQHGAALLDATIVAAADGDTLVNQHRSDRNAAFLEPTLRFVDSFSKPWIHEQDSVPGSTPW